jgi:F-type H+-transporting ATPase subunit b
MSARRKSRQAVVLIFAMTMWTAHAATTIAAEDHPATATAGGEHANQAEEPNLLAFNPDLAIFSAIVFLLLLGLLSWFAWPQITAALEERERQIADNIAAAEARHADAKRLLAEHEAKLAAAAGEVRALLDEAKRDAEHTRRMITEKGHQDAQDELQRAVREIERARDAAIHELAVKSADVAVDLARNVVTAQLTPERQSELVREALGKLTAAAPSKN